MFTQSNSAKMMNHHANRIIICLALALLCYLNSWDGDGCRIVPVVKAKESPTITTTSSSNLFRSSSPPELTSTALRLHKIYSQHPPHDRQLYEILRVPPNATLAQIQKSYRQLLKIYHPDKRSLKQRQQQSLQQQQQQKQQPVQVQNEKDDQELRQIQRAYEILREDSTRIFYHKYGLTDPRLAVLLLLGPCQWNNQLLRCLLQQQQHSSSSSIDIRLFVDTLDQELMRLMGYDEEMLLLRQDNLYDMQQRRIQNIACMLVEQIRPIVERQLIDPTLYYRHVLAQHCDRWKRLPLGSQIIRCVGRAYRHVGQDFLTRYHQSRYWNQPTLTTTNAGVTSTSHNRKHRPTNVLLRLRKHWHSTKHWLEAGAARGKLAVMEYLWKDKTPPQQQPPTTSTNQQQQYDAIEYHDNEEESDIDDSFLPLCINDEVSFTSLDELEMAKKRLDHRKAQTVLIQAMEIEALWKACKIDLDRIVRTACEQILDGKYFFFPSFTSEDPDLVPSIGRTEQQLLACNTGWVATTNGITIDAEQARVTAAQTMILFGNIMVEQSKQGTSWKH